MPGCSIDGETVRELLAERDTLAARVEALHKALRNHAVKWGADMHGRYDECMECHAGRWAPDDVEIHAKDCLAAPSTPATGNT